MDKLHTSMKEDVNMKEGEILIEEILRKIKFLRANYDPNGTEMGRKNDLEKMLRLRKLIEQLEDRLRSVR